MRGNGLLNFALGVIVGLALARYTRIAQASIKAEDQAIGDIVKGYYADGGDLYVMPDEAS